MLVDLETHPLVVLPTTTETVLHSSTPSATEVLLCFAQFYELEINLRIQYLFQNQSIFRDLLPWHILMFDLSTFSILGITILGITQLMFANKHLIDQHDHTTSCHVKLFTQVQGFTTVDKLAKHCFFTRNREWNSTSFKPVNKTIVDILVEISPNTTQQVPINRQSMWPFSLF